MVGWDAAGIPKEKLVLVLSLYGQSWQLIGRLHRFEAGAPASGATPPFGYANTEGRMFYHDICEQISGGNLTRVFDTDGMAPYAHNNETLWVSYDDVDSCKIKARWVLEKGYGGVAFYELSMEDYDGSCGHDSFLTLHGVAEVFATASRVNINDKRGTILLPDACKNTWNEISGKSLHGRIWTEDEKPVLFTVRRTGKPFKWKVVEMQPDNKVSKETRVPILRSSVAIQRKAVSLIVRRYPRIIMDSTKGYCWRHGILVCVSAAVNSRKISVLWQKS